MGKILLDNRDITSCDNKLKYLLKIQRKQFISSCTIPYWLPSFDYGKSVGEKSHQLYVSLSSRGVTSSWALRPTSGKVPLNPKTTTINTGNNNGGGGSSSSNNYSSGSSLLRPKSGKDVIIRDRENTKVRG